METELKILKCSACGNTFPLRAEEDAACPACGSEDVHLASEPLL